MVDLNKLKEEQVKLAKKVVIADNFDKISTVGGVCQAYSGNKIISMIAVCDFKDFEVIEKKYFIMDSKMRYKSSFLFYREGIAVIEAYNNLENKPDILMINANGILHPRRFGMASHLGILLDMPTIGITQKLMLGEIKDKTIYFDKEARGYEFITREHAKPIYVSPGHKVSLSSSLEIIKKCISYPHKLPMPLFLACRFANKIRKETMIK